jgi:hypothetical protein
MSKARRNIGREILDGLRQLKRGEYGRVTNTPDVASIRAKTGLSQAQFAELMGVSVRTLQDWGTRAPCSIRGCPDALACDKQKSCGATGRRAAKAAGNAEPSLPFLIHSRAAAVSIASLRQVHLAQERLAARIAFELALRMRCSRCGNKAAEVMAVARPRPRRVPKNPH